MMLAATGIGDELPEVEFISAGNSHDVANDRLRFAALLPVVAPGISATRLIDRDDHSDAEVADFKNQGIRVLSRRHLECFLYDNEVIKALCVEVGRSDKSSDAMAAVKAALDCGTKSGRQADDVKAASGVIYNRLKELLGLSQMGNTARAFALHRLAPLIKPGMEVYDELHNSIFPDDSA